MKKIKLNTKIYVSVLIAIVILISISSVNSSTLKFGDDPNDATDNVYFGYFFTNESGENNILYGGTGSADDILLYGSVNEPYSMLEVQAGESIQLYTNDFIRFLKNDSDFMRFEYHGDNVFIFGNDSATSDLIIQASEGGTGYPKIELIGDGASVLDSATDIWFKEQGVVMGKFELSGTTTNVYGGSDAGDEIVIYGTSAGATTGRLVLDSNSNSFIDTYNYFQILKSGNEIFELRLNGDDTEIYGGDASQDDVKLFANNVDSQPYIELNGDGVIALDSKGDIYFKDEGNVSFIFKLNATDSIINATSGHVMIDDVLQLEPISTPPANPEAGMLYYDSDDNTAYCYNGAGWQALY